jgi:hypothetical protein
MGTVRLADIGPPRTPTQYPGSRSRQREEFESRSEVAEHIGQCSGPGISERSQQIASSNLPVAAGDRDVADPRLRMSFLFAKSFAKMSEIRQLP